MMRLVTGVALVGLLSACGDDPTGGSGGGGGVHDPEGCPAGSRATEGGCSPAGVSRCAEGFEPVERGCVPILPAAPCPPGTFAVAGEESCHAPSDCGSGTWGDIATDAQTQHVDGSFAGTSDGSAASPWRTIQQAIDGAPAGGVVAVAAGSYVEDVAVAGKPVRLYGRCAQMVEIVGGATALGAILITTGADKTEIRDLAIRGSGAGVALSGSSGVVASGLWIHDTGSRGVVVQDDLGPTDLSLTDSLIESATEIGVFVLGAQLHLDRVAVRGTKLDAAGAFGMGVSIGINPLTGAGADGSVSRAVIADNHDYGVFVEAASASVDASVVTGTLPTAGGDFGRGIGVQNDAPGSQRSLATITQSYIAANHDIGVFVMASDVVIDNSVITGTLPKQLDDTLGRGISAQGFPGSAPGAVLTVTHSLIANNHEHGVVAFGSELTLDASAIIGSKPRASDQRAGRGVTVQFNPFDGTSSNALVRDCDVSDNTEFGIVIVGASATIEHSAFRRSVANGAGEFGDGIGSAFIQNPTSVVVTGASVEDSARAGISCFGAALALGDSRLSCNPVQLNSEAMADQQCMLSDLNGNTCHCGETSAPCAAKSANLAPPEAVTQ